MIRIENVKVWGFPHAVRGMRNPLKSHAKSDTQTMICDNKCESCRYWQHKADCCATDCNVITAIGKNDMDLMKRLYIAGTEHRKYLRQIFVSMDITASHDWWSQFDTYKVGVTENSESKMHKMHDMPITPSAFNLDALRLLKPEYRTRANEYIAMLEQMRREYNVSHDKDIWVNILHLLPMGFMQKRTVTMNYENVASMILQRRRHKLNDWREFVLALYDLPYIDDITDCRV